MSRDDQTIINTANLTSIAHGLPNSLRPHLLISLRSPGLHNQVRVVCHRGDWRNYIENTLEAIESCIRMGADVVEVDVGRTKDGHLILMHDETLDRTSNGHGYVCDHTLEEIRALRLKDGLGNMTEFVIPTVEEALLLAKNRILVNLDKADKFLDEVEALLVRTGMLDQVILKSELPFEQIQSKWGDIVNRIVFMPIVNVTEEISLEELRRVFSTHHDLYEINFETEYPEKLRFIQKMAYENGAALWFNTIWPTTCGGFSDDRALKNKDATWGHVINNLGAGLIQTDRPEMLLNYLKSQGDR